MRRLFAMLTILGMLMLPACDIFTKPGGGPDGEGGGGGGDGDTGPVREFTVILILDSVQLPDSIVGYTLWIGDAPSGPSRGVTWVFDQVYQDTVARETAFVGVGVRTQYGDVIRDKRYVGNEGSDTVFVGYAPAPFGPLGWTPPEVPDTLDLRWFCLWGGVRRYVFTPCQETLSIVRLRETINGWTAS